MASNVTPLMVKVPHTSMKCCRWALASSWGFPQNGLACTMLISTGLSSKVASPKLTWGPVATLVADGAEKSEIIFWGIASLSSGAEPPSLNGSEFEMNLWGGTWRHLVLLTNCSGSSMKLLDRWKPLIQCLASQQRETKARVSPYK